MENECTALLYANLANFNGFVDFVSCMDTVLGHPDYVTNPVHMQCMLGCSVGYTRGTIIGFINQPANYKKHYDTAHSKDLEGKTISTRLKNWKLGAGKIISTRLKNWKLGDGELGELEVKHEGVCHKCTLAALASKGRAPYSRTDRLEPPPPPTYHSESSP